ncbi:hypothetical protein FOA52_008610 [Chlamydomonas sp. UWO 241]|nr:hypothetical protein FOA52_008610 [Chlamydomonas sp. UWO 241]
MSSDQTVLGPDAKRNFPGEIISEMPPTVGENRKAAAAAAAGAEPSSNGAAAAAPEGAAVAAEAAAANQSLRSSSSDGAVSSSSDADDNPDFEVGATEAEVAAGAAGSRQPSSRQPAPVAVPTDHSGTSGDSGDSGPGIHGGMEPEPEGLPKGAPPASSSRAHTGHKRKGCSSEHIGVSFHKGSKRWSAYFDGDPQTKGRKHLGNFDTEEDAARAYDFAAVQALGPGAERNFPGETISEMPATVDQ